MSESKSAVKEGQKLNKKIRKAEKSATPNQVTLAGGKTGGDRPDGELESTPLRDPTSTDEQFPTGGLQKTSEKDVLMTEKLALADDQGVTPFGQLIANDSMFHWLQGKREQEAEANFQQWFATNFDKMSPTQKALARELFPSFYQQRLEQLDKNIELQRRIARLKIEGIKSKDDLFLQYAIEAGYINPDQLEEILHPERVREAQDRAAQQLRFKRGLLNPRRNLRGDWGTNFREGNATTMLNRTTDAFGTTPAYALGTGGNGFSVIADNQPEDGMNYKSMLENFQTLGIMD